MLPASQCWLLAVLDEATLWAIDPFRIKKIYVTVGDINPFIIRAIVHSESARHPPYRHNARLVLSQSCDG